MNRTAAEQNRSASGTSLIAATRILSQSKRRAQGQVAKMETMTLSRFNTGGFFNAGLEG